jgi:hypothetical protein
VAQVLSDAQQPSKGQDKVYGTAEKAFEAVVEHYRLEPHRHEIRYSFTMYTAGGLFRHAWCEGLTVKDLKKQDKVAYQRYLSESDSRCRRGWDLYNTIESLVVSLNTY